RLLPVALDGARVSHLGRVWVAARVAQRAALTQQVPAAVELDLDCAEALVVGFERVVVVHLLAVAELVLLGHQLFDVCGDAFVTHGPDATPAARERPRRSRPPPRAA